MSTEADNVQPDPTLDSDSINLETELASGIEALMDRFSTVGDAAKPCARQDAEALVEKAYEEEDPKAAVRLLQEALRRDSSCVIAYLHLAQLSTDPEQGADWLSLAVEAGERELGPEMFSSGVGRFWRTIETQDYMRARQRLGQSLWVLGRHDDAIEHFLALLRLNPRDHQGIRHTLASSLIELGRDSEAEALLLAYEMDRSTPWVFNQALLAFRREGDTPAARKHVQEATLINRYASLYLINQDQLLQHRPRWDVSDLELEALEYAESAFKAWSSTEGAIAWLERLNLAAEEPESRLDASNDRSKTVDADRPVS